MATIPVYKRQTTPNPNLNSVKNNARVSANSFGAKQALLEGNVKANQVRISGQNQRDAVNTQIGELGNERQASQQAIDTFSAVADTAGKTSLDIIKIMDEKKREQEAIRDQATRNEAYMNYLNWDTTYTQDEVLSKQGKFATPELLKQAKADREKKIEELTREMSVENASAFKNDIFRTLATAQRDTAKHISQETKAYAVASQAAKTSAIFDSTVNRATVLPPEEIEKVFADEVLPELQTTANAKGLPADELIKKAKANLYTSTINQAVAKGNLPRSAELLERWQSELAPSTRASLTATIRRKAIDAEADSIADKMVKQGVGKAEGLAELNTLKDLDLKKAVKTKFKALIAEKKVDETVAINDGIISSGSAIQNVYETDGVVGVANYYRDMPEDTAAQRKIKNQVRPFFSKVMTGAGIDIISDAGTYVGISDKIDAGVITDEKSLRAAATGKLTDRDADELVKQLKGSQDISDKNLKQAFAVARGKDSFTELPKNKKAEFYNFAVWARENLQETNKAKDPEYIQKLADMRVIEGEAKGAGFGYGRDMSYAKAVQSGKLDEWLPETPKGTLRNQIEGALRSNPEYINKLSDIYGDDPDLIIRGYYKELILNSAR